MAPEMAFLSPSTYAGCMSSSGHHDHAAAAAGNRRRLAVAFWLTATVLVVELIGAVLTRSLVLAVDAMHMLTDVLGLGLALAAGHLAARPATPRYTWGYERAEIISAMAQSAILLGVGVFAIVEGVQRLFSPQAVPAGGLIVFGVVGLAANLVSLVVLSGGQGENLSVRAALLEVANDAAGSVAVLLSGVLLAVFGWSWVDTAAALLVAALILPRAVAVLRRAVRVLMEAAPDGLEAEGLRGHLEAVAGVVAVHDLHVSRLSSATTVLTAHVVVPEAAFGDGSLPALLCRLETCAAEHFEVALGHVTFQLEPEARVPRERPLHHPLHDDE